MSGVREIVNSWPVVGTWTEPADWQQPRPALFVRGGDAYITEPATKKVHQVELATGKISGSVTLDAVPNEISGAMSAH